MGKAQPSQKKPFANSQATQNRRIERMMGHKIAQRRIISLSRPFTDISREDLIGGHLELAPRAGFEPATRRLTAVCSTD